ncbi:MAG: hypothetical protein CMO74_11250 [Verrucomicrobiales bacterium]|nr:hypothetical protein [Verrucomicrobiales bacterium]|tara:strand:- start:48853 stop:49818 length:966 start_codon:yes stop_codon:yes gene_type:complete
MKRIALLLVCAFSQSVTFAGGGVSIVQDKGKVVVKIDGKLFTEYHYTNVPKPVLYPVRWIDGTAMTRRFPMEPPKPGESNDHKHHRSLWWGHRHVKGGKSGGVHDFWGENSSSGKQVQTKVAIKDNSIQSWNKWVGNNGETVATDSRTITFHARKADRMLDYSITIHASEGDLELQDDKDAGMSIRVPDTMCVSPHGTSKVKAKGHMLNSEGVKDAACWGKRAKWVNYHGTVEGKTLGVTIFDHPDNPRHPSNWHARSYGLCAANVFGKRHFERLPDKSAGNMKLKRGERVTFNYRFVWHAGPPDAKQIEEQWKKFSEIKF